MSWHMSALSLLQKHYTEQPALLPRPRVQENGTSVAIIIRILFSSLTQGNHIFIARSDKDLYLCLLIWYRYGMMKMKIKLIITLAITIMFFLSVPAICIAVPDSGSQF